ncbi:2OG-Fe(II) oxygenase family protein [Ceratobasidium sp. AG-Ba]|nr:2OG-Fe(II) oxygenase family protein [Ceratobasidium sp. AG-Ba]
MHSAVLPLELSCRLYHAMLKASEDWSRNKWWMVDKLVESPHTTSFYARHGTEDDYDWREAAQYWYNGRPTAPPRPFLPEMEEACEYIEKTVNEAIKKRPRYPLEWAGVSGDNQKETPQWRPNIAAANCYRGGKEGVGYHSDQMTYLGPYPTIASLSLGTTREFRLREVIPKQDSEQRQARTYIVPLPHNSLIIMHPPCQERFKHTIPSQPAIDMFRPPFPPNAEPSNARINITFRFYRPDFRPDTTPRCACGTPCVLRADMKGTFRPRNNVSVESNDAKFMWQCYSGAQTEAQGCAHWSLMDIEREGRGPVIGTG